MVQKATIAAQQTGVEAAAASAVLMGADGAVGDAAPLAQRVFNRQYLLLIVDVPTGAVLFVGDIEDPTNGGSP